jgi:hypothetical protein
MVKEKQQFDTPRHLLQLLASPIGQPDLLRLLIARPALLRVTFFQGLCQELSVLFLPWHKRLCSIIHKV